MRAPVWPAELFDSDFFVTNIQATHTHTDTRPARKPRDAADDDGKPRAASSCENYNTSRFSNCALEGHTIRITYSMSMGWRISLTHTHAYKFQFRFE